MSENDAFPQPGSRPPLVDLAGGDSQPRFLGFVGIRRIRVPHSLVQIHEQNERSPGGSLVPIWKRVVPCQTTHQDRRLVLDIRVELDVSVPGLRSVKRRVGQIGPAGLCQGVGVNSRYLLCQPVVLGESDVPRQRPRRSSSSLSRSSSRLARPVKS